MNFIVERGYLNAPIYTIEQIEYIVSRYTANKDISLLSLSKEFNVSPPTLKKLLIREGVDLKTLRDYRMIYQLNEFFFDIIDTEEKSYWLGFLYADGVINEDEHLIRINLSRVDRNHLEKFREAVSSTHPIKETSKTTKDKVYYGSYIGFKSSHMIKSLVDKGCFQRKTEELTFPMNDIVPDHLVSHFVRGYFDGDGSISYTTRKTLHSSRRQYKIGITGTQNIVGNIRNILGSNVKIQLLPRACVIQMGGNTQCQKIYEYMYKDATIYLTRKHEKFIDMISYIKENPYVAWNKNNKHKTHTRN